MDYFFFPISLLGFGLPSLSWPPLIFLFCSKNDWIIGCKKRNDFLGKRSCLYWELYIKTRRRRRVACPLAQYNTSFVSIFLTCLIYFQFNTWCMLWSKNIINVFSARKNIFRSKHGNYKGMSCVSGLFIHLSLISFDFWASSMGRAC